MGSSALPTQGRVGVRAAIALAVLILVGCTQTPPDVSTNVTPQPEVLYEVSGTEMTDAEWCLWVRVNFGTVDGFLDYVDYQNDEFEQQARRMWEGCS